MKEHPILFSGPMVQAILAGQKTVTRRAVKPSLASQFDEPRGPDDIAAGYPFVETKAGVSVPAALLCPYGQPGDRLWVRETLACTHHHGTWYAADDDGFNNRIDDERADELAFRYGDPYLETDQKRIPSIHMPRWACRILLEVTAVGVERLQDISDEQCLAEGLPLNHSAIGVKCTIPQGETIPRVLFKDLWVSTGGDWDANPWVWVVDFRRVQP